MMAAANGRIVAARKARDQAVAKSVHASALRHCRTRNGPASDRVRHRLTGLRRGSSVSIRPRSVSRPRRAAVAAIEAAAYSSRIQNGWSARASPARSPGSVSCWMHHASAAAAVRCDTDRDPAPDTATANRSSQRS